MDFSSPYSRKKLLSNRRWYDNTFAKTFINSLQNVPAYKQEYICSKVNESIDAIFKNEINRKVNTNKNLVLGMYKEYEKRRWYDKNAVTAKTVKKICSLVDQRKDLQKVAFTTMLDILEEYYVPEEKEEVAPPPPPEPTHVAEKTPPEETKQPAKANDKQLMVSGEKLFIKRERRKKKSDEQKPSL